MVVAIESREHEINRFGSGEIVKPPQKSVVAHCIILNEQGEILLLQRDVPGKRQLEVPGGGVRPNETPERAALRETWEEVRGIESLELTRKVITTRYRRHGRNRSHINFLARASYDELFPNQKMHKGIGFYSWEQLEQMDQLELARNVRMLLKAHQQGKLNLVENDVTGRIN